MKIIVRRTKFSDRSTIGQLVVDGEHLCDTLEDQTRGPGIKVYGKTSIPPGAYRVIINYSPAFKRELPLLLNVPNFEGIRIHSGNDDSDTEGCILVGTAGSNPDWISNSRDAFNKLFPLLQDAVKRREDIWLTIEEERSIKPTAKAKK